VRAELLPQGHARLKQAVIALLDQPHLLGCKSLLVTSQLQACQIRPHAQLQQDSSVREDRRRQVGLRAQLASIALADRPLSRIAQGPQVTTVLLDHHNRRVFCAAQATSVKAALQIRCHAQLLLETIVMKDQHQIAEYCVLWVIFALVDHQTRQTVCHLLVSIVPPVLHSPLVQRYQPVTFLQVLW
jgi:hypothetical protein